MVKKITKNCSRGRAGDVRPRPMRTKTKTKTTTTRRRLHAIFERLKRDNKLAQRDTNSAKQNLESLTQETREFTIRLAESTRTLAQARRTIEDQNALVERMGKQLIDDYLREQILDYETTFDSDIDILVTIKRIFDP
ncbi:hypothetical protein ACFE04_029554 [Oxalis oulophora]